MVRRALAILIFALVWGWLVGRPAWRTVSSDSSGRDFATYHYAWQAAAQGEDPYDKATLGKLSKADKTRNTVNPYFYPPPFLLAMAWDRGLSLAAAYRASYWINLACMAGVFVALRRWLSAPWWLLGGIALTWTPLPNNLNMGQANPGVLLLMVLGLWRGSGALLASAAMAKMSPALLLAGWVARGRWRPVAVAVGTAVALSLVALPLVGLDLQWRFYTDVLPKFAGGPYHQLSVPITLEANHSIPDLMRQIWPGPDRFTLSDPARRVSQAISLVLLGGLFWVGRRCRDALAEANLMGALTVLMTLTPVYTYEHHLLYLILPWTAAAVAALRGRLPLGGLIALILCYAVTAWPLSIRPELKRWTHLPWLVQEIKFFGSFGLGLLCAWAAARSGPVAAQVDARVEESG